MQLQIRLNSGSMIEGDAEDCETLYEVSRHLSHHQWLEMVDEDGRVYVSTDSVATFQKATA